jgi:hypothetical protein
VQAFGIRQCGVYATRRRTPAVCSIVTSLPGKGNAMYLVLIAWLYVVLMMAVAEATNSTGTLLGAVVTFVLYGVLPMGLVYYLMRAPARRAARLAREREQEERSAEGRSAVGTIAGVEPDAGGHPPAAPQPDAVAPMRKEP